MLYITRSPSPTLFRKEGGSQAGCFAPRGADKLSPQRRSPCHVQDDSTWQVLDDTVY